MNKLKLSHVIVNLKHFHQCVAYHCGIPQPERHLVAHLGAVTDFACRDLSDSLFQLYHQHFIEHQECLPEGQSTGTQSMHLSKKKTKNLHTHCAGKMEWWWGDVGLPIESGPWWRALIFWCTKLRDSLLDYFLHCFQNVINVFKVGPVQRKKI